MRESELPYVLAAEAINVWLDGGDPRQVLDKAPEHLRELVRRSAKSQAELIKHWAIRHNAGAAVPRAYHKQVNRYLEVRGG